MSKQNRMTLEEICSRIEAFIGAPDASRAASFDALAHELFHFQFEHNGPYRRFCENRGVTPANLRAWSDTPAIITSAFKELELSVLPPASRSAVFHSSGTTGQRPSRHFHSRQTLGVYERSLLQWFMPHVLSDHPRANFLMLTPSSAEAPHSSLVYMLETITRAFTSSVAEFCGGVDPGGNWVIDFERVFEATPKFSESGRPMVVCGTAFSFVHLCDFLEERGEILSFPPGSRVFETGGYKGRSRSVSKTELHAMISRALSIPQNHIISEYGMSELSSQAYDSKPGESQERIYQFPPWARPLIVSPETGGIVADGETGLLRVVDLANVGSVMAIQTEDLARRRGSGFELLGRAALAELRGCSLMELSS
jgi:phenylacetate-coenzyme A ligase PaaK-like adenylate-forming protein